MSCTVTEPSVSAPPRSGLVSPGSGPPARVSLILSAVRAASSRSRGSLFRLMNDALPSPLSRGRVLRAMTIASGVWVSWENAESSSSYCATLMMTTSRYSLPSLSMNFFQTAGPLFLALVSGLTAVTGSIIATVPPLLTVRCATAVKWNAALPVWPAPLLPAMSRAAASISSRVLSPSAPFSPGSVHAPLAHMLLAHMLLAHGALVHGALVQPVRDDVLGERGIHDHQVL